MAQAGLDKTAHVVGIDIGGTGIKGAPVDLELGSLSGDRVRIPTPHPATPGAVADAVVKVLDQIGVPGPVGLTLPAVIRGGKVQTASNIDPAWMQTNVAELFAGATGRDVGVVNDADAAGIAEIRFGAGKGRKGIVVMVTLGTGIGSAVFSHGVLVPNSELGHLPLHREDAEDWAAESVREHDDLSWKKWAHRLQRYLERVELLLWPDLIIIGGGVSKKCRQVPAAHRAQHRDRAGAAVQRRGHRRRGAVRPGRGTYPPAHQVRCRAGAAPSGRIAVSDDDLDTLSVNTIRTLCMDAIQAANSGHPGTPMGHRPGRVHALAALPALRPGRPDLAQPRPLRAVGRTRLRAAVVAAPPHRRAGCRPRLRGARPARRDPRRPQDVPPARLALPRAPGVPVDQRRGDHDRPARPGRGDLGRDGDRRAVARRPVQPRRLHRSSTSTCTRWPATAA